MMLVLTQTGDSALLSAAFWNFPEIVALLLRAGANIDLEKEVYMYSITIDTIPREV